MPSIPLNLFPDSELPVTDDDMCECSHCGSEVSPTDAIQHDGADHCPDCVSHCESCDASVLCDDLVTTSERRNSLTVCPACCFECADCNAHFRTDGGRYHNSSDERICPDCAEQYYTCDNCSDLVHSDDTHSDDGEGTYCHSCYMERESESSTIHDYSYKPEPHFQRAEGEKHSVLGRPFFGMEIEFDAMAGGAKRVTTDAVERSHILDSAAWYVKHDSSLNDGFECVSHPGTWEFWKSHSFGWLPSMLDSGYRSYDTTTCGMHIHVSKSALSSLDRLKLLQFFKLNQRFITRLSRRRPGSLDRWAKVDDGPRKELCRKVANGGDERYEAINLLPSRTVEFRLFRGTADKGAIMRNLAFVATLCAFVKQTSLTNLYAKDYLAWLKQYAVKTIGKDDAKRLIEWIKKLHDAKPELVSVAS